MRRKILRCFELSQNPPEKNLLFARYNARNTLPLTLDFP
jgi:hypothetical protein